MTETAPLSVFMLSQRGRIQLPFMAPVLSKWSLAEDERKMTKILNTTRPHHDGLKSHPGRCRRNVASRLARRETSRLRFHRGQ